MFLHTMKYAFKTLLKSKESIFWTLAFPIALATFMNIAFGNIYENTELFSEIPVTVIEEKDNPNFSAMLKELSSEENNLLDIKDCKDEKAAKKLLEDGDIYGIIYVNDEISLTLSESGYNQTVLKIILEKYSQTQATIMDVVEKDQTKVQTAVEAISSEVKYYKEVSTSDGNQDQMVSYFYAIFAMSCLFASFSSVDRINKIQPDCGALGQRRAAAPTNKLLVVLSEFISIETLHFVIECLTLLFMKFVLKIDFGNKYPAMLLILFMGTSIGVAIGILVGTIRGVKENGKIGIVISISMILSVMADLCVGGIRDSIEHTVPILNRINPAALIVDSFYALNVYDTYSRFTTNMIYMAAITVVLCASGVFMLKRKW